MKTEIKSSINAAEIFKKFGIPSMITFFVMGLIQNIDKLVAAILLGNETLAIVNIVNPLIMLYISFVSMLITGLSVQVNFLIGKNESKKAGRLFTGIFIVALLVTVVFVVLALIFQNGIFTALNMPENYRDIADEYFPYIILSFFGLLIGYSMHTAIIADRNPKFAMIIMLSNAISNLVLNIVLVKVFNMGIQGLGIATLASSVIMAVIGLSYFVFKLNKSFKFEVPLFDLGETKEIVYNGSSEFFTIGSEAIAMLVINFAIIRYLGHSIMEAYSLITLVSSIILSTMMGGVVGILPIISEELGKSQVENGKKLYYFSIKRIFIISGIVFLVSIPAMHYVISHRVGNVDHILLVYIIYGFALVLSTFTMSTATYFTALKKPFQSILVGILRSAILIPIISYVSIMLIGTIGIGIAYLAVELMLIPTLAIYRRKVEATL